MKNTLERFTAYPVCPSTTLLEKIMTKLKCGGVARCPVCGSLTLITEVNGNLRESCKCLRCESTNRQRQIAYVMCCVVGRAKGRTMTSIKDVARLEDFVVYNTEAGRQLHDQLSKMKNYVCSEYFGKGYHSGDFVNGVMHQDLTHLSFDDKSMDLVISSDVFEHIQYPYRAHKEVYRVLKPGGSHIFTVPFYQAGFLDEARTFTDTRGNTVLTKDPIYHGDPIRSEGALVHKIFSLEMLVKLAKIGFRTRMYRIYKPSMGIVGSNALVFEAVKE